MRSFWGLPINPLNRRSIWSGINRETYKKCHYKFLVNNGLKYKPMEWKYSKQITLLVRNKLAYYLDVFLLEFFCMLIVTTNWTAMMSKCSRIKGMRGVWSPDVHHKKRLFCPFSNVFFFLIRSVGDGKDGTVASDSCMKLPGKYFIVAKWHHAL